MEKEHSISSYLAIIERKHEIQRLKLDFPNTLPSILHRRIFTWALKLASSFNVYSVFFNAPISFSQYLKPTQISQITSY